MLAIDAENVTSNVFFLKDMKKIQRIWVKTQWQWWLCSWSPGCQISPDGGWHYPCGLAPPESRV